MNNGNQFTLSKKHVTQLQPGDLVHYSDRVFGDGYVKVAKAWAEEEKFSFIFEGIDVVHVYEKNTIVHLNILVPA